MARIAVLGAGHVGGTLGLAWAATGHDVVFGTAHPKSDKTQALLKRSRKPLRATTVAEAVPGADVVVLATPWEATESAVREAGGLSGKLVVDCTNPLGFGADGAMRLTVGHESSGGEQVAKWAEGASVFKTLNHVGFDVMADPSFPGGRVVMFVAGDDDDRKPQVLSLVRDLGFDARDAGPLRAARYLEPLAMLWIHLTFTRDYGRNWAFGVLQRQS